MYGLVGDDREEPLDLIELTGVGRHEVHVPTGMLRQSGVHFRVLVAENDKRMPCTAVLVY